MPVTAVVCGPGTPPGALTLPAWQALLRGPVLVSAPDHPQLPALAAAGIAWTVAEEPVDGCIWLCSTAPPEGVVLQQPEVAGARLLDAVAVMDRLRSPGGCPWDARQTHASLMPYLLEEAYETYEALENGDAVHLREELGDLLLQILFHARIAEDWGVDEVAGDLVDKLVRRHPHVFAGASADDLEGSWEAIKAVEKGRVSVTEGIPLGQPALMLSAKLQRRAATLGMPRIGYEGLAGELWDLVGRCAAAGLDPEVELRTVARAFRDRLQVLETSEATPTTPEEWSAAW